MGRLAERKSSEISFSDNRNDVFVEPPRLDKSDFLYKSIFDAFYRGISSDNKAHEECKSISTDL